MAAGCFFYFRYNRRLIFLELYTLMLNIEMALYINNKIRKFSYLTAQGGSFDKLEPLKQIFKARTFDK